MAESHALAGKNLTWLKASCEIVENLLWANWKQTLSDLWAILGQVVSKAWESCEQAVSKMRASC